LTAIARPNFECFFSTANTLLIYILLKKYSVIKVITEAIKKLPAGFQDTTTDSLNAKKKRKPSNQMEFMHKFLAFTEKDIMYIWRAY
jgi:hypothetical protein